MRRRRKCVNWKSANYEGYRWKNANSMQKNKKLWTSITNGQMFELTNPSTVYNLLHPSFPPILNIFLWLCKLWIFTKIICNIQIYSIATNLNIINFTMTTTLILPATGQGVTKGPSLSAERSWNSTRILPTRHLFPTIPLPFPPPFYFSSFWHFAW